MNTNNLHDFQTERFEEWLRSTTQQDAPDLQERILAQFRRETMSSATNGEPQKHFFLRSWISQIAALAAVVAIGFFTLSMVEQAPDPMQQNTLAAAHDVPPLILNDLILLEDEVTSLSWLLDEGNQITLASYLAQ